MSEETEKHNDMVMVELIVDQFGPFDRPEWTNGVFYVRPDQAEAIREHFTNLAESYGKQGPYNDYKENLQIHIRPVIQIPLAIYDRFIYTFTEDRMTFYLPVEKIGDRYKCYSGTDFEAAAADNLEEFIEQWKAGDVLAYTEINTCREILRTIDVNYLGLDWENGTLG